MSYERHPGAGGERAKETAEAGVEPTQEHLRVRLFVKFLIGTRIWPSRNQDIEIGRLGESSSRPIRTGAFTTMIVPIDNPGRVLANPYKMSDILS